MAKDKIYNSQITVFYDSVCTDAQQIKGQAHRDLFIVNFKAVKTGANGKCIERNKKHFILILRILFLNVQQQLRLLTRQQAPRE